MKMYMRGYMNKEAWSSQQNPSTRPGKLLEFSPQISSQALKGNIWNANMSDIERGFNLASASRAGANKNPFVSVEDLKKGYQEQANTSFPWLPTATKAFEGAVLGTALATTTRLPTAPLAAAGAFANVWKGTDLHKALTGGR